MAQYFWKGLAPSALPLFQLPADRITTWQPGVTYNGGIPTGRTQFGATLSPLTTYAGIGTSGPTVTISIANPAVVGGLSLSTNTQFFFETTGTLPAPVVAGKVYFVLAPGGANFTFSASFGGAAVSTVGGTQSGTQTIVLDDTPQIQAALGSCPANQTVKLSTGVFRISQIGFGMSSAGSFATNNNITFRGSGSGDGTKNTGINGVPDSQVVGSFVADAAATQLIKWDRATSSNAVCSIGQGSITNWSSHTNLTADAVKGTNSCVIASNPGLSVGQCVTIEMVTDFIYPLQNVAITVGTPTTFDTSAGGPHGLSTGSLVFFNGTLPTGLSANTGYAVLPSGLTSTQFQVSKTPQMPTVNGQIPFLTAAVGNPTVFTYQDSFGTIAHGLSAGDTVYLFKQWAANPLPAGLVEGTPYTISATGLTATSFQIATATSGNGVFTFRFMSATSVTTSGTSSGVQLAVNLDHPDVYWGYNNTAPCQTSSTRATFHRQDTTFPFGGRSIGQIMRISNIAGTTITFETPFHMTMQTSRLAQLTVWNDPFTFGCGFEDFFAFGGTNGGVGLGMSSGCWIRNVESMWNIGNAFSMASCYRCEIRDSYAHEMPISDPGGSGYLIFIEYDTSDCLIENCVSWYGNKVNTMQSDGGGNVIAYNYMDDAADVDQNPSAPEAGVNAGHNCTTPMTLIEGNYSHNVKGDGFWGGSPYMTVFRNWISGLRAAAPPLNTHVNGGGDHYGDLNGRIGADIGAGCYKQNIVGNIFGFSTQRILGTETGFSYENTNAFPDGNTIYMYNFGSYQLNGFQFDATTINTQLRQGNFDWFTGKQIWYANLGDTGMVSTGPSYRLANSLYIPGGGPPAFWSGTASTPAGGAWPPVNPSNGAVSKIPAHKRFETITGLTIPPGNQ